ncbi:MarR family winged helix-turn-helix transcriptional regulator [Pseudonocardia sp. GCM10023141]|uniref:MarR family winged helix-turn-helix transcriptional regulator n=1 Tax=Pseudonocardia sp. GCM10023141 TaxID=3252653 RepID=UPI003617E1DC
MDDGWFDADPAAMPLARLLTWTGAALAQAHRRAVGEHGLTSTGLGLLGVLAGADGMSHRDACGRLGVTPATLTPVVDALERDGAVVRVRDVADRRIVRLAITAPGRERLHAVHAEVAATLYRLLPTPAPEQAAVVRDYLHAVLAALPPGAGEG